jgi:hypothetical protein
MALNTLKRTIVLGIWGGFFMEVIALSACGHGDDSATTPPPSDQDSTRSEPNNPCAGVGCGPVPICGEGCVSQCGCCTCSTGQRYCEGGTLFECTGGCFSPVEICPTVESCVTFTSDGSSFCAKSPADCDAVRSAYESWLVYLDVTPLPTDSASLKPGAYNPGCSESDCAVQAGHCQTGLGPCWFLGRLAPELDRLSSLYASLGCPAVTTCNCPDPVMDVHCETGPNGMPAWTNGNISATTACIVH